MHPRHLPFKIRLQITYLASYFVIYMSTLSIITDEVFTDQSRNQSQFSSAQAIQSTEQCAETQTNMLVKIRVVQANSQSLRWMKMNFLQEAVSSVQNVVEQFNCVASTLQWNTATGTPHPLVCSCFRAAQSCIIIIS